MYQLFGQAAKSWEENGAIKHNGLVKYKMFSFSKYEMFKMHVYDCHKNIAKRLQPFKLWTMYKLQKRRALRNIPIFYIKISKWL